MRDDTPALFISPDGARAIAQQVAQNRGLKVRDIYAHRLAMRDTVSWTAYIVSDSPKGKPHSRYVTNDDVDTLH